MARKTAYNRHTDHFKATAVNLSKLQGVQIKDVAEALDIHPFMLSRLRKGLIMVKGKMISLDPKTASELKRLKKLEKNYTLL
jgi:transposase